MIESVLKRQFTQKWRYVIIYSPSCHFKPVCRYCFSEMINLVVVLRQVWCQTERHVLKLNVMHHHWTFIDLKGQDFNVLFLTQNNWFIYIFNQVQIQFTHQRFSNKNNKCVFSPQASTLSFHIDYSDCADTCTVINHKPAW